MDYEELGNFSNLTFEESITPDDSVALIVQEVIFAIITLIALFINIITIYTILRYRVLRDVPNYIIVNWALSDCLSHLTTPSIYRIMAIFGHVWIPIKTMCILLQFSIASYSATNLFVTLLTLDWCFAAYFEKHLLRFRSYFRYYIGSIWGMALLILCIKIGECVRRSYINWFQYITIFGVYLCLCVFTIVLQLKRLIAKSRGFNHVAHPFLMLNIASVFVMSWSVGLGCLATHLISTFENHVLGFLSYCFIYGSSIFTFTVMYIWHENFNACVKQIFKRKNKYNEMEFTSQQSPNDPLNESTET